MVYPLRQKKEVEIQVPVKYITRYLDLSCNMPGNQEYIHKRGFKRDVRLLEDLVIMEEIAHLINQEKPIELT